MSGRRRLRKAITLVETLIALGVVAILTLLVIMGLRHVRGATTTVTDLAGLGASMHDFLLYAEDHDGRLPNVGLPRPPPRSVTFPYRADDSLAVQADLYWSNTNQWPRLMTEWKGRFEPYWHSAQGVADPRPAMPLPEGSPMLTPSQYALTLFEYSPTLITKPSLWTFPGRAAPSTEAIVPEYEIVAVWQVRHPSGKGVLAYLRGYERSRRNPILAAFADGAASSKSSDSAKQTAVMPLLPFPTLRGAPVAATLDGYQGVDF